MMGDPGDLVIYMCGARLGYESVTVIENVDFTVPRGQVVAVLGGSGTGKTTLLQTILGLVKPLAGEVRLLGQVVSELDRAEQARLFMRIGVVFQQNALFSDMTVAENLAVVARELTTIPETVIGELVTLRLDSVGLQGLGTRRPDSLSGGQRKRVAFARAIMLEPEVLFFDEPTAGLDPIASTKLVALIRRLRDTLGATLVIITHDIELIRAIVDRVVVVGIGEIHADGRLDELLESNDPMVVGLLRSGGEELAAP